MTFNTCCCELPKVELPKLPVYWLVRCSVVVPLLLDWLFPRELPSRNHSITLLSRGRPAPSAMVAGIDTGLPSVVDVTFREILESCKPEFWLLLVV